MEYFVRVASLFLLIIIQGSQLLQAQHCCRRASDTRTVGYDLSGRAITLDIGRCTTTCQPQDSDPNRNYQSVLERILEKKSAKEDNRCSQGENYDRSETECHASLTRVEAVALATGPQFFDVVESCECRKVAKSCERIAKQKKFFAGTKFESIIDVGECVGGCKTHKHHRICRETKTTTHSIKGPNGDISITAVDQCRCEQTCYRQNFNVAVTELARAETGILAPKTKVIDVGRCVGSCGSLKKCVVKDHKQKEGTDSRCLMSLETSDVKCAPTRAHKINYMDEEGHESYVIQIRKCGCS